VKVVTWSRKSKSKRVDAFLSRPAFDPAAEAAAARVIADIRKRGDAAVSAYVKRFDGAVLKPRDFRVDAATIDAAGKALKPMHRRAIRDAHRNVKAFAKAGLRRNWDMRTAGGGRLGERFTPFDRIGVYVPGGEAPLSSTVVMTVTLAKVAGVKEIVVCTPADAKGNVDPMILHAARHCGATEVYRVGGIQSVAAMAYGTASIARVQKIVGPGGPYVTAAKKLVYGAVSLDQVAGPSEIAVLADSSAKPAYVAADLISQAEHGTGHEKILLVTTSRVLARKVEAAIKAQTDVLPRRDAIRRVLDTGAMIAVVPNLDDGMELCNRFAPEHFEIMVASPRRWLPKVRAAGAIFLGPWSPEPAGDYAAGPSHVLPTGGAAARFSGLSVDDFRRRSSVIDMTRKDLALQLPTIEAFAAMEGLHAHGRSAAIRFDKDA
jgi:histidinol dehydrogenase